MACNSSGGKGGSSAAKINGATTPAIEQDLSNKDAWEVADEYESLDAMQTFENSMGKVSMKNISQEEMQDLRVLPRPPGETSWDVKSEVDYASYKLQDKYRDFDKYGLMRNHDRGISYEDSRKEILDRAEGTLKRNIDLYKKDIKDNNDVDYAKERIAESEKGLKDLKKLRDPKEYEKFVNDKTVGNNYDIHYTVRDIQRSNDALNHIYGKTKDMPGYGTTKENWRMTVEAGIAGSKPLDRPVITFRGVNRTGIFAEKDVQKLVGVEYKEKTFTSTTLRQSYAKDWINAHNPTGEKPILMRILQPKGAKGFMMDSGKGLKDKHAIENSEHEWLTNSKGTYKIVKAKSHSDHDEIWVERRLD